MTCLFVAVERFGVTSRRWDLVSDMYAPRSNFAASLLDGMIFVVGGFNGERGERFSSRKERKHTTNRNRVQSKTQQPRPKKEEKVSCTCCLPPVLPAVCTLLAGSLCQLIFCSKKGQQIRLSPDPEAPKRPGIVPGDADRVLSCPLLAGSSKQIRRV